MVGFSEWTKQEKEMVLYGYCSLLCVHEDNEQSSVI